MNSNKDGITHQGSSVSPPWWAMADLTLLANWTASSPSFKGHKFNIKQREVSWIRLSQHFLICCLIKLAHCQTTHSLSRQHHNLLFPCDNNSFPLKSVKIRRKFCFNKMEHYHYCYREQHCIYCNLLHIWCTADSASCIRKSRVQSYVSQHWQKSSIKLIWRHGVDRGFGGKKE